MNDFKFGFRQLLKNPGFTAVAGVMLALGIGATTAINCLIPSSFQSGKAVGEFGLELNA